MTSLRATPGSGGPFQCWIHPQIHQRRKSQEQISLYKEVISHTRVILWWLVNLPMGLMQTSAREEAQVSGGTPGQGSRARRLALPSRRTLHAPATPSALQFSGNPGRSRSAPQASCPALTPPHTTSLVGYSSTDLLSYSSGGRSQNSVSLGYCGTADRVTVPAAAAG